MVENKQQWLMFDAMVILIIELEAHPCTTTENQREPRFMIKIVLRLYHM